MNPADSIDELRYAEWLAQLRRLARAEDLEWVVDANGGTHREAFLRGASPIDEFIVLKDMGQWRGCGCGGC